MLALITGITGQDGSYLSELLLDKGYQVFGIIRRNATCTSTKHLEHIRERLHLRYGDMTDSVSILSVLQEMKALDRPCEIYHLAAQSHVMVSFQSPIHTMQAGIIGTQHLLDAIRLVHFQKQVKFYHASSSEMFGLVQRIPQDEKTPFYPRSPYAISKQAGHCATINARESYGLFACNGILFNHESPRRAPTFVTRKITSGVNSIATGKQQFITLGNLNALRDWGHAQDYVEAMWLMLQQPNPNDYVISSNEQHSVREFCEIAFALKGFQLKWQGEGVEEMGLDQNGFVRVKVDEKFFRPAEVETLLGDSTFARTTLNWKPRRNFIHLVKEMVNSEM